MQIDTVLMKGNKEGWQMMRGGEDICSVFHRWRLIQIYIDVLTIERKKTRGKAQARVPALWAPDFQACKSKV
jgi:hypothetical protein